MDKQIMEEIGAERRRQIEVEGFTADHDDNHFGEDLMDAAMAYYGHAMGHDMTMSHRGIERTDGIPACWPWEDKWWKPKGPRRDLIRAGALCMAEQDRCLRDLGCRQALPDDMLEKIVAEIERRDQVPKIEHIIDFTKGQPMQDSPPDKGAWQAQREFRYRVKACPIKRTKRRLAIMIALATGHLPWGVKWDDFLSLSGNEYILCCGHVLYRQEAQLFADHGLVKPGEPDSHGRPTLVITDAGRTWLNLRW